MKFDAPHGAGARQTVVVVQEGRLRDGVQKLVACCVELPWVLKMSQRFELVASTHRSFVALATLRLPGHPLRRFTKEEAAILSRALDSVATGDRGEQQIYMSPIASDHDFDARVEQSGVVLSSEGHGDVKLDWSEARALAEELRSFASG